MDKITFYHHLCRQLSALLDNEHDIIANMANTSALLYESLPDINWVGFYRNIDQRLLLGPFQGKTACFSIPYDKGVCGACFTKEKVIRVDNVKLFPTHIACDCASLSEIVLPVFHHRKIIAVLDIDAPILCRFNADDEKGLLEVVSIFEHSINKKENKR